MQQTNAFRKCYGAGPLTWDDSLAAIARTNAKKNANQDNFEHINGQGMYGENLWKQFPKSCDLAAAGLAAEKAWEGEEAQWRHGDTFSPQTGHFTQVVWKGTTRIGCSAVAGPGGPNAPMPGGTTVVSCVYAAAGNNVGEGQFAANVGKKDPQCSV